MTPTVELVGSYDGDLASLDVSNFPIGANVEDINTGSDYILRVSDAVVDHDTVESVLGHPELRWLKQAIPRPDIEIAPNNTYAAPANKGGSEANDGLSWATPKLYATSAVMLVDSLGGGTANIADGTLANPVSGRGINLSGPFDVGTFPVDKGWVRPQGYPLRIVITPSGNPQQFSWGQGKILPRPPVDEDGNPTGPAVWLGPQFQAPGFFGGIIVENANFDMSFTGCASPAAYVGYSSELADWDNSTSYASFACVMSGGHSWASLVADNVGNTPGVDPTKWGRVSPKGDVQLGMSLTAFFWFKNCAFGQIGPDTGPGLDVGYLFWAWFEQCVGAHGNATLNGDPMLNCSIRYLSTNLPGVISYLQYWRDCRFNVGGIYADGGTDMFARNVVGENMVNPMFTFDLGDGRVGSPSGTFDDIQGADSANSVLIQNNGSSILVVRDYAFGSIVGPAQIYNSGGTSLITDQQVGISGAIAKIQHDSARRGFGPVTSSLPNIALTLSETPGTTPVTGVDGRPNAGITGVIYEFRDGSTNNPNAGDLYAFGAWIKFTTDPITGAQFSLLHNRYGSGDITINLLAPGANAGGNQTLAHGDAGLYFAPWLGPNTGQPVLPGQWTWFWAMFEVVSVEAGAALLITADATQNYLDRPWMIYAASGTMTKAEFAELALASVGTPNAGGTISGAPPLAPALGMPAYQPGTAAAFWDKTLGVWQYTWIDNGVQVISTTPPA